ncbi:uncharacterized protein METZ01_LOCUS13077 [marine metagenome]|uniref:Uncharacterized protein n=1 Tax=marine metagenome TaxID=408172 RepID=A0A381P3L0_9ZZZZ
MLILSLILKGLCNKMMEPAIKFETTSFRANPRANPVNPKPATNAETFIPKVPSDVIKPKTIRPIFAIRPIRNKSCLFNPRLFAILIIKNCVKRPLTQKSKNIKILNTKLGRNSAIF